MEEDNEHIPGGWEAGSGAGPATHGDPMFYREPSREPGPERRQEDAGPPPAEQQRKRRYGPRTCRICLEVVQPTFPRGIRETLLGHESRPTYVSEDAELGRLISPCKCKGSQKYVHQGCLQAWRRAAPLRNRNYFQCPTCGFRYRLDRMSWASHINSASTQMVLTLVIVFVAVFILGFVADYIFDLWLDPLGVMSASFFGSSPEFWDDYVESGSWADHFLKGFYSLGIIGMFKAFWAMNPYNWWNIRNGVFTRARGRRPGHSGRGRVDDIAWVAVVVGTLTAVYSLWKGVRFVSRRALTAASNNVLDVGGDDADEEEEDNWQREQAHPHAD